MSVEPDGPGPYSKRTMRRLAITGPILGVLVLGWGIKDAVTGDPDAPLMLGVGVACLAVFAIGIPLARRRGRL